jgi:putative acyl-CoA dehydrogenase
MILQGSRPANQSTPLEDYNVFSTDCALVEAARKLGCGPTDLVRLERVGQRAGDGRVLSLGAQANANPPVHRPVDRFGERIDEVDYHPAYHELMATAVAEGLHSFPWSQPRPGAHLTRAAAMYVWTQAEMGHGCPISMTYASLPALRLSPELVAEWGPRILSSAYEPALRPDKPGALLGMAMTERQGGSDVRANTTAATHLSGDEYLIDGHKWFCSAPMSDAFLVLAQAPDGLTCFLLPRMLPDGRRNGMRIVRLKDKLGNRSNASSEVEYHQAWARRVGDEGQGVRTIIEMVALTRLDVAVFSAALMRQATAQALHHARQRQAFGARLTDLPAMRNVLVDLALESEAAMWLALRLAAAVDGAHRGDEWEEALRRIAMPVAKYWVPKRAQTVCAEALECLGGNGYIEESGMPRLYREAPLNSIWEGASNVNGLDMLRAVRRTPAALDAVLDEIDAGAGTHPRLEALAGDLRATLPRVAAGDREPAEWSARRLAGMVAVALQGSLLARYAPQAVADAFIDTRVPAVPSVLGTLPPGVDAEAIVTRAIPAVA